MHTTPDTGIQYARIIRRVGNRGTFEEKEVEGQEDGEEWGAYQFVACLSHLTIDHASQSSRSTVPISRGDNPNIWALITFLPHILRKLVSLMWSPSYLGRLWGRVTEWRRLGLLGALFLPTIVVRVMLHRLEKIELR